MVRFDIVIFWEGEYGIEIRESKYTDARKMISYVKDVFFHM